MAIAIIFHTIKSTISLIVTMIALSSHQPLTPEQYLEFEKTSEVKHEYIDGEIYAMAGTTKIHNTISLNLALLLRGKLSQSVCQTYMADVKVSVSDKKKFFYPDLVVTCDENDDESDYYIQHPRIIIEILSPSTESFDRGKKFAFYRKIPSLQEYILVNTEKYLVECFRRQSKDIWLLQTYEGQAAIAQIEALGMDVPLVDIYATVELPSKA